MTPAQMDFALGSVQRSRWNIKLPTDFSASSSDHRVMARQIERVCHAMAEEKPPRKIWNSISAFIRKADKHIKKEMAGSPSLAKAGRRQRGQDVIQNLKEFRRSLIDGAGHNHNTPFRTKEFLEGWLLEHISQHDENKLNHPDVASLKSHFQMPEREVAIRANAQATEAARGCR